MKAAVLTALNQLSLIDVPEPVLGVRDVLVSIHAAALNHRDVWIKAGQYGGVKYPTIPGSDGAGIVTTTASPEDSRWLGQEVIVNPSFSWGSSENAQAEGFGILGLPRDGTLAEKVSVPVTQLAPKPSHLSWQEAAALPLAGLTAYRALFSRAKLEPGERVLVSGIGGGVATFALQFAVARGAEVYVTSSSPEKIAAAVSMGAAGGFDYTKEGWSTEAAARAGAFNVIVDSAGGEGFERLVDLAAPGARIVFYGATKGDPPKLPMRKIFWRQLSLMGTTMGSPRDWAEMVALVAEKRIKPVISHVFAFSEVADAFGLMERSAQFGKIVVDLNPV